MFEYNKTSYIGAIWANTKVERNFIKL